MEYSLAKQLKDAGFQFHELKLEVNGVRAIIPSCGAVVFEDTPLKVFFLPTLSELIEACGDFFWELKLTHDGEWKRKYFCIGSKQGENEAPFCDTPEEAVAKLWITLNKRN